MERPRATMGEMAPRAREAGTQAESQSLQANCRAKSSSWLTGGAAGVDNLVVTESRAVRRTLPKMASMMAVIISSLGVRELRAWSAATPERVVMAETAAHSGP